MDPAGFSSQFPRRNAEPQEHPSRHQRRSCSRQRRLHSTGAGVALEFRGLSVTTSARVVRAIGAGFRQTLSLDVLHGCVAATKRATAALPGIGTSEVTLLTFRQRTIDARRARVDDRRATAAIPMAFVLNCWVAIAWAFADEANGRLLLVQERKKCRSMTWFRHFCEDAERTDQLSVVLRSPDDGAGTVRCGNPGRSSHT